MLTLLTLTLTGVAPSIKLDFPGTSFGGCGILFWRFGLSFF